MPVDDEDNPTADPQDIDIAALLGELGVPEDEAESTDEDPKGDDATGDDPAEANLDTDTEDEAIEKLVTKHNGDARAVAKELANLRKLQSRQAAELGDLRKQRVAPPQEPEDDTPKVGPRGFPLDDLGVEYVPPKLWASKEYHAKIASELIAGGADPEEAAAQAPFYAAANQAEFNASYHASRARAQSAARGSEEKQAREAGEAQKEAASKMGAVYATPFVATYGEAGAGAIAQALYELGGRIVARDFNAGKLSVLEASSPKIIPQVYAEAYALLVPHLDKIADAGVKAAEKAGGGQDGASGRMPASPKASGQFLEKPALKPASPSLITDRNADAYVRGLSAEQQATLSAMESAYAGKVKRSDIVKMILESGE